MSTINTHTNPHATTNSTTTIHETAKRRASSLAFFDLPLGRAIGTAAGLTVQGLFLYTVYYLFLFLRFGSENQAPFSMSMVAILSLFFAWPHSILLLPSVQSWIKKGLPAGFLGLVHCTATCVSLLILFHFWTVSRVELWHFEGNAKRWMLVGFYGSWIALFYSLYLSGLGYQTGLTQWWHWLRKTKPPRREFVLRGVYRWMRHPVYLSFLGLIWFTPTMTLDHAILTLVWTAYIYLGSYLKDRRMLRFIGKPYESYAREVPGFVGIGFGPWGRWKHDAALNDE